MEFLHITELMLFMPLATQIIKEFNLQAYQYSLLAGIYEFAGALLALLFYKSIDRWNLKQALFIFWSGFLISTFACAASHSYFALFLSRMMAGVCSGMVHVLIIACIAEWMPESKYGRCLGIVQGAYALATILGVPLGIYFASSFGWRYAFYGVLITGLILFALYSFLLPRGNTAHHHQQANLNWKIIFQDRNARLFIMIGACTSMGTLIVPFIAPFFIHNIGFREIELSYLYLIGGAISIIVAPLIGQLTDYFCPKKTVIALSFLFMIPMALLAFSPALTFAMGLWGGVAYLIADTARHIPINSMMIKSFPPETRKSTILICKTSYRLIHAIGIYLAGYAIAISASGHTEGMSTLGGIGLFFTVGVMLLVIQIKTINQEGNPETASSKDERNVPVS
jgi:predicted MFS family arabinose efflux permease